MSLNKLTLFFATVSVLLSNIPAHAAVPGQNGKIVFQSDSSGSCGSCTQSMRTAAA
jgi:hypothetical protein